MRGFQRRWWYVERPFPWWLIAAYLTPVVLIAAALIAVEVWK